VHLGQQIFERIARLSRERRGFTSVAAIGGPAAGGGCELALACDFVVLANSKETRIGLPEVQLGILPGWGGCERLPRKIGVPAALDAILNAKLYSAREALKLGIADRTTNPEDLLRVARDIALRRERLEHRERVLARLAVDKNPLATRLIAGQARKAVLAKTRGFYPAPIEALEIVARAPHTDIQEGLQSEVDALRRLAAGPVAKNLIRIFRLSEEAKKQKVRGDGTNAAPAQRIGVLGAGVMGRGIASLCAERGAWTRLFDIAPAALDTALVEHRAAVGERRKRRKLEKHEAERAVDRLDVTRALAGFGRCEIVIEAVAEKLEVKRAVFAQLAQTLADDAILATNTSSLSVAAIAEGLPHPERVAGLHFFNPVKKMPLLEIVRGPRTSDETLARCAALALELGKTPVVVADVAGFLANRLLGPYLDECVRLFEGGVEPARLEALLHGFGLPMGPLELLDEVGLDIAAHAAAALHAAYGARMTPASALSALLAQKRLGKKSGHGFYVHAPPGEKREKPVLASDLVRFVPAGSPRLAVLRDDEILDRALLAMLNEAARALEERVVAGARELDLATVFGMGFPPFRGGLLAWADTLGAVEIVARLERVAGAADVAARSGGKERFTPAERLRRMARSGARFHD
jgi:3-hydroxyacyl-CoA dehydrogenase / enoyl-CoA hydratase / 3-hydroxybutyryl-CoA epimerase